MKKMTFIIRTTHYVFLCLILSACSLINDAIGITKFDYNSLGKSPDKLRFIAIGDTGKGNLGQYQVAQAMQDKCEKSGCDFILLLGDNIYKSGVDSVSDKQFQSKFELPYKKLDIPFFAVLGNHDYGGNGKRYDPAKSNYQVKYSEISKKWHMPQHYYHFDIQHTSFFALDTNAQLVKQDKQQKLDMVEWINASTSTWKIAFGHHPYLSNGQHGNAGEYDGLSHSNKYSGLENKIFTETILCGKVDLYISGHDHDKQWLKDTCKGTQFTVSGAGSSTRQISGINPTLFENDELGFLYISIDGAMLNAEFIDVDGNVEFKHSIKK